MKKKMSYGALLATTIVIAGTVGNAQAAWDTSGVDIAVVDELTALDAVDDSFNFETLTVAETEVAIKTLLPSAVASSISAGVQSTGVASVGTTLGRVANLRSAVLYSRLKNAPVGPAGPTSSENVITPGVWGKGMGSIGDQDAISDVDGYEYDSKGVMFGYDWLASQTWLFGLNAGTVKTNVDAGYNLSASTDIDSLIVGFYGTYSQGIDYLDVGFTYIKGNIDTSRQIIIGPDTFNVVGETNSSAYVAYADLGRNFIFNSRHIFSPSLGVQWSSTLIDGYAETGTGGSEFADNSTDLLSSNLGFKYEYIPSNQIHMKFRGSWIHEWTDNSQSSVSSRFTALGTSGAYFESKGVDVGSNRYGLGLGVKLNMTDSVNMDLDYDLGLADEFVSHTGTVTFKYNY